MRKPLLPASAAAAVLAAGIVSAPLAAASAPVHHGSAQSAGEATGAPSVDIRANTTARPTAIAQRRNWPAVEPRSDGTPRSGRPAPSPVGAAR